VRVAQEPEPAVQPANLATEKLPMLPARLRDPKLLEAVKQRARDIGTTP
jgi:hypothetical protein